MMKKKSLIVIACAIGIMVVSAVSAFAATNARYFDNGPATGQIQELTDEQKAQFEEMRQEMDAKHEDITQAAIDGDYDTWHSLVSAIEAPNGNTPEILEKITEDNFAEFSKAHQLMKDAQDIFTDLGLDKSEGMMGFGDGPGMGRGHGTEPGEDSSFRNHNGLLGR